MYQIAPVLQIKSLWQSLEFTKPPIIILSHKAELMFSIYRCIFLLPCCHVLLFQSLSHDCLSLLVAPQQTTAK